MTKSAEWISPEAAKSITTEKLGEFRDLLRNKLCPEAAKQLRNMDRSLNNVRNELKRRKAHDH